jgi:hypothetical protein
MATQLLPAQDMDSVSLPAVHWCCILVTEHPVISLCGHLTNGRRLGAAGSGMCTHCLELAPTHAATCIPCARWVPHVA